MQLPDKVLSVKALKSVIWADQRALLQDKEEVLRSRPCLLSIRRPVTLGLTPEKVKIKQLHRQTIPSPNFRRNFSFFPPF